MDNFYDNLVKEVENLLEDNHQEEVFEFLHSINSPMMIEYTKYRERFKNYVLFFQIGDFYETYADQAEKISNELNMKLTSKQIDKKDISMCGFPVKSGEQQANQLAKLGYNVLFINQEKDENDKVYRIPGKKITPSTICDDDYLENDEHQYLMVAYGIKKELGVTLIDMLSGEVITRVSENINEETVNQYAIFDLIARFKPKEVKIYLNQEWEAEFKQKIKNVGNVEILKLPYYEIKEQIAQHKENHFNDKQISYAVVASHMLMFYHVNDLNLENITIRPVSFTQERDYLYLHSGAFIGLEVFENNQTRKKDKTIFDLLDKTITAKGSRMVKSWLQEPLINEKEINNRYTIVEFFIKEQILTEKLRGILKETTDIERSLSRFEKNSYKNHELITMQETFLKFKSFFEELLTIETFNSLQKIASKKLTQIEKVLNFLNERVCSQKIVKEGYNKLFDDVRRRKENGLEDLKNLLQRECEKTGIKNLKLENNKVLGYFFEVTKSQYKSVPEYFIEKKELSNKKQFVTEELVELEKSYLEALESHDDMFRLVIKGIVAELISFNREIKSVIEFVSILDVLMGFSEVSRKFHYKRPVINGSSTIDIKNGIHPLLQAFNYQKTIPNHCRLENQEIQIITGPNMGGKSTYLKMVGTLLIMAQVGCFVPARLTYSPVDRILLRMGANDAMVNNQSTFMVEMDEVAYILYHSTEDSLILMDELGRGTSTSDGISIAHAVIDHIHNNVRAKAICSTHYHELTELEKELKNVTNYHAEAIEENDDIQLTYKIVKGGSPNSFGIEVAKRAGLPNEIIQKANDLLKTKYTNVNILNNK